MSPKIETYHIKIYGLVQGVGFRLATVRHAHALKVTGWVRNLGDGSVEAYIQGSGELVDEMMQWFNFGPPRAQVSHLDIQQIETEQRFQTFDYR